MTDSNESPALGPEDAPATEAERDALEHLRELDEAAGYPAAAPDDDPLAMSDPLSAYGPAPVAQPPLSIPRPAMTSPKTLADLYARHPEVGGEKYLQIYRLTPRKRAGVSIAGFLDEVHSQIDLPTFAKRYGGGTYEVLVMGHGQNLDQHGQPVLRTLDTIKVELPGEPTWLTAPSDEHMAMRQPMPSGGANRDLELQRLQFEREDRLHNRQQTEQWMSAALNRSQLPEGVLKQLDHVSEKRAQEVRLSLNETIATLRTENDRLRAEVERKDVLNQELRGEVVTAKTQAAEKARQEENARVTELKDRYERDIRQVKDEQAKALERLTTEQQTRMSEMTERYDRERRDYQEVARRERERLREEAARREEQLTRDADRREEQLRSMYESRLASEDRSAQRELASVRDQCTREVGIVKESSRHSASLSKETAAMQIQVLDSEKARIEAECTVLRRENEDLRARTNKGPLEAVTEAKTLLDQIGAGTAEEADFDWRKGAVSAVKGLFDKLPEIADRFGEARNRNQAQRAAQIERARAAQQARARQLAAPPATQQMVRMSTSPAPPPAARPAATQAAAAPATEPQPEGPAEVLPGARPPRWGGGAASPEPSDDDTPSGSAGPERPTADVPSGGSGPRGEGFVPGMIAPAAASAAPPAEREPEPDPEPAATPNPASAVPEFTQEAVLRFIDNLEMAIAAKYPVEDFAQSFYDEAGPEVVRLVVSSIAPAQIIEQVRRQPKSQDAMILTPYGQQYLAELWEAAKIILEQNEESA